MTETSYEWSTQVAYGVFYAAILSLATIAILWSHVQSKIKLRNPNEDLISARNSQRWWSIAASFFSSAMGSWVLTLPAEIGSTYGWWGVLGYSLATALPWAFLAIFGPKLRQVTAARGFTAVDFLKQRLGLPMHFLFLIVQLGVVFLAFVAEAVTIGSLFQIVAPGVKPVAITVSMAVIVYIYTFFAGIRATLLTDRIQFCVLSALIIVGISAIMAEITPKVHDAGQSTKGSWTKEGFLAFWILNLSCFFPTFMDPSSWSRMYAAKSERDGRLGLLAAAGLLLIPMTIFGAVGIVGRAAVDGGVMEPLEEGESTFFKMLTLVRPGWSLVVLIMATCLSASTVDTLASGISTLIAAGIHYRGLNYNWARLISFVIFIIALIVAVFQVQTVLTLFMVGNLIATFTTPILLLSLWDFVTPASCAAGILSGAVVINIMGACFGKGRSAGFDWWLSCGTDFSPQVLGTFIASGATSAVVTVGVAQLQFWMNPQKRAVEQEKFERLISNTDDTEHNENDNNGKSASLISTPEIQQDTSLTHRDLAQESV